MTIRPPLILLAMLSILLAACGTAPPVPSDRYYRLSTARVTAPDDARPTEALTVHALRAESLYAERAMVFTDARNPRELRQYHYRLWLYPPSQLVQDHLIASLANAVNIAPAGQARLALQGRILRFDQILGAERSHAAVTLELQLLEDGRPISTQTYEAVEPASDDSFTAFVEAMERALSSIYQDLLGQLGERRADAYPRTLK
jgi:ABC-type uncharacterized transport system auxiliary subunit